VRRSSRLIRHYGLFASLRRADPIDRLRELIAAADGSNPIGRFSQQWQRLLGLPNETVVALRHWPPLDSMAVNRDRLKWADSDRWPNGGNEQDSRRIGAARESMMPAGRRAPSLLIAAVWYASRIFAN
jgi:hypothetical protein